MKESGSVSRTGKQKKQTQRELDAESGIRKLEKVSWSQIRKYIHCTMLPNNTLWLLSEW